MGEQSDDVAASGAIRHTGRWNLYGCVKDCYHFTLAHLHLYHRKHTPLSAGFPFPCPTSFMSSFGQTQTRTRPMIAACFDIAGA